MGALRNTGLVHSRPVDEVLFKVPEEELTDYETAMCCDPEMTDPLPNLTPDFDPVSPEALRAVPEREFNLLSDLIKATDLGDNQFFAALDRYLTL